MTQPKLPTGWWLWRTRASEIRSVTGSEYVAALRAVTRAGIVGRCRSTRLPGSATPSSTRSSPTASPGAARLRAGRPDRGLGRAADRPRLQGRRPVRGRRAARRAGRPRRQRALPDADLQLGLEPSLPRLRLPGGRPAARRRRRPARAARPRPTRAGMRVVLDGVFNHCGRGFWPFHHVARERAATRRTATGSTSIPRPRRPAELNAYPRAGGGRARSPRSATGPGGACRRCRSSTPTTRRRASTSRASAEHWLRFGIDGWRLDVPDEIDDRAFWREFRRRCRAVNPEAYLVGEIWDEAPELARGRHVRRADELPARRRRSSASPAAPHLDQDVDPSATTRTAGCSSRSTARRSRRRLERSMTSYDPDDRRGPAQPHRQPRHAAGADGRCGGDRAALRLAMLLQMTLPGAPSHLLRRRDRHGGRPRPRQPARLPGRPERR